MAFKMKGGNDPMKKNFGSALNAKMNMVKGPGGEMVPDFAVDGKGANDLSPKQMKKDSAPMMRMDASAMKAMGKPAPVKAMDKSALKKPLVGNQDKLPEALQKEILAKQNFKSTKLN